jgi:hypothetical protein
VGVTVRAAKWLYEWISPGQLEAWRHLNAVKAALERESPAEVHAAYGALREVWPRYPGRDVLGVMLLMSMQSTLWRWGDDRWREPVRLDAAQSAFAGEMWADLNALAAPDPRPLMRHMLVRVLDALVHATVDSDPPRAADALELMTRFRDHCDKCAATYYYDVRAFGARLKNA